MTFLHFWRAGSRVMCHMSPVTCLLSHLCLSLANASWSCDLEGGEGGRERDWPTEEDLGTDLGTTHDIFVPRTLRLIG